MRRGVVRGDDAQARQRHQQKARVEHAVGVADAGDDAAVDDAAHGNEHDHRRDQHAGVLRRQAKAALQQQGRVEQQRIHRHAHQQRQREQRGQAAVAEHVQRQEGMRAALFPPDQQHERGDAAQAQQHDGAAYSFLGQQFHQQLQAAQRQRDQQGALPVQAHLAGRVVAQVRQVARHEPQAQDADGQVHVEHGPPAIVLGQRAAQRGADGVGNAEGRTQHHLPAQAHVWVGEQVGDGGERGAHQHAAADALQGPRQHQRQHAVGRAAQGRGQGKEDDGGHHEGLAPVVVAQAAEDRHGDDRRQQVGRGDPGVQFKALELGHDGGQRGAHDRLVDGDHHHDKAHAQHGQQRLPEGQHLAGRMWGTWGGGGHYWMHQRLMDQ
ncbi:hypothetical protein D3C72_1128260 [compost metagenome]